LAEARSKGQRRSALFGANVVAYNQLRTLVCRVEIDYYLIERPGRKVSTACAKGPVASWGSSSYQPIVEQRSRLTAETSNPAVTWRFVTLEKTSWCI